ncbi:MAG: sigma-70 family RNA polymerase sigma factor [Verrucomicrobiota bacterium]
MNPPLSPLSVPDDVTPDRSPDRDDEDLLREYRASRDEPAFRALVQRHFPAVWSTARRLVNGDAALAEDVSQEVFTHLATHAQSLPPRVVLGGWLHRHTCFTAAKAVRAASRRRSREQLAAAMNHSQQQPDPPPWPDIAPHLDAALNALPAADRDAVILRFFENRGFSAIARTLNTSEDAVRMRTSRALEKLRRLLGKHSSALTAAALAALLRENSIAASALAASTAPAGAAARIATTALARAASLPAAGTGAAAEFAALTAALRGARPALIGGTALLLAVTAVWKWNAALNSATGASSAALAVSASPAAVPPKTLTSREVDVTVHFILVPEAAALAIMNQRWNADGDTDLLAKLLREAGPAGGGAGSGGVRVAQVLTGTWKSETTATLRQARDVPALPKYGRKKPPVPRKGETAFMPVGSTAMVEVMLSDDGQWCDLNLKTSHHFAEPVPHFWPDDPGGSREPGPSTVETTEFRESSASAQLLLPLGGSTLVQCSQLPALSDAEAGRPALRLFTFVTAQPVSPS